MQAENIDITNRQRRSLKFSNAFGYVLTVWLVWAVALPVAAEIDLIPGEIPQSNVLFLIDDALNLDYEKLMDREEEERLNIDDYKFYFQYANVETEAKIRPHCTKYNKLAYDPSKTYEPWWGKDSEGNDFADQTDITSVPFDPYLPKSVNIADADKIANNQTNETDLSQAFYLVWNDNNGNGEYDDGECPAFERVETRPYISLDCVDHRNGTSYSSSECVKVSDMTADEQTNFANWYAYHRKREYVLKYALAEVIQQSRARVGIGFTSAEGFHNISTRGMEVKDVDDISFPIDADAVANKEELLTRVFALDADAVGKDTSQVRRMYEAAGNYFEREEVYGPGKSSGVKELFGYEDSEDEPESPIIIKDTSGVCQANATVVIAARFENGSDSSRYSERVYHLNIDGDNSSDYDGEWVDGTSPKDSYADDYFDTLADVAMFFYERDLYPDIDHPDVVQRMSTHMVALGVKGTLEAGPTSATEPFAWPQRVNNHAETIDDMRHAAWNGRGEFHDPGDGDDLLAALKSILFNVDESAEDNASALGVNMLAVNSVRASTDSTLYISTYEPISWEGHLLAFPIDQAALDVSEFSWDAADLIPSHASRNIFSYNGSAGFEFNTSSWTGSGGFSDMQKAALNALNDAEDGRGLERVAYLRGDPSNEQTLFRSRSSLLGDIVHSDVFYTADENHRYYNLEGTEVDERTGYYLYLKNSKTTRQPMIYVGANDGMLHGFYATDADSEQCTNRGTQCAGEEAFAYVPKGVYEKLSKLTSPDYSHAYYVDGQTVVADAYLNYDGDGSRWGSVLVATLGYGGAGVFALDASDPGDFSADDVLWDLDETDLSEMGEQIGRASIVKLQDGRWAVIVANGYDSANHKAGLYIIPLEDPEDAIFIDTGYDGTEDDPNGLSAALPIDSNGDNKIDRVYAGDLYGNMWAFDLSSEVAGDWTVAYKDSSTPKPLFRACQAADCADLQPITSRPQVVKYDGGDGHIVLFGTGRYMGSDDVGNTDLQSFYGVRDDGRNYIHLLDRSSLQKQTIELEFSLPKTGDHRVTSQSSVDYSSRDGWYIDFDSGSYEGERIISDPVAREGTVRFFTFTVDSATCSRTGGKSWYMQLDSQTGARTEAPSFDVNGDGKVDDGDLKMITLEGGEQVNATVSGFKSDGLVKTDHNACNGGNCELQAKSSDGQFITRALKGYSLGRQSWIQVQ